jgi:hypothetical protein
MPAALLGQDLDPACHAIGILGRGDVAGGDSIGPKQRRELDSQFGPVQKPLLIAAPGEEPGNAKSRTAPRIHREDDVAGGTQIVGEETVRQLADRYRLSSRPPIQVVEQDIETNGLGPIGANLPFAKRAVTVL